MLGTHLGEVAIDIALWILNALLAALFLGAGLMKLVRTKDDLRGAGMAWTDDFSAAGVRGIGLAEVAGAIGLILPLALDIAPIVTPIAALGLMALMIGASRVHRRRAEPTLPTAVLAAVAASSAVLGFIHVLG